MQLIICQLIAAALIVGAMKVFGLWLGAVIVAALIGFQIYWKLTRGEWFE